MQAVTAGVIQLVECQLPKLDVAGSSPVARSLRINDLQRRRNQRFRRRSRWCPRRCPRRSWRPRRSARASRHEGSRGAAREALTFLGGSPTGVVGAPPSAVPADLLTAITTRMARHTAISANRTGVPSPIPCEHGQIAKCRNGLPHSHAIRRRPMHRVAPLHVERLQEEVVRRLNAARSHVMVA